MSRSATKIALDDQVIPREEFSLMLPFRLKKLSELILHRVNRH
jgi:hypothetical protein